MSEWIKCTEERPPIGKQVLAYGLEMGEKVGGANIEICVWDGYDWWNEGGTELDWGHFSWSHWMPLPPPPEHTSPSQGSNT